MSYIKINTDDNFINLIKEPNKQFSFSLKTENGFATGYCDLSDDEYEAFKNVFQRMADNLEQDTNPKE